MIDLPSTTYKEINDPPCLSQKYGRNFLKKNLACYGAHKETLMQTPKPISTPTNLIALAHLFQFKIKRYVNK